MTGTTRIPARPSDRVAGLVLAAGLGMFGALFVLGSRTPWLLVLAPVGAVGLVLAARKPLLALIVMVVTEVTNLSGVLAPGGGLPLFPASMLLGLVTIAFALRDPQARQRLNAWTGICIGLLCFYLVVQGVAAIGSVDVMESLSAIRRTGLDCLFAIVLIILIQLTGRQWAVAAAIVIPLAVLSALTIVHQVFFTGATSLGGFSTLTKASGELITTPRYGGPLPDSNFWGRHLVMGVPLTAALLTRALRADRHAAAAGWLTALLAILGGIYLTQSRGTFISVTVATFVWFVVSGRPVWKTAPLVVPFVIGVAAIPGVGDRLVGAFSELSQGRTAGNLDPSLLGRLAAQQQAALMWQERPVFGFGPGTFPGQVFYFAGRVSTAVREPTNAPHNIYVELAAEAGTLGLLSWIVVVVGFLLVLGLRITAAPRSADRILAAAAFAAIIGWSVASLALHMAYFRTFGVVLALAGGLAPAWPPPAGAVRRLLRTVGVGALAGTIGAGVFTACWAVGTSRAVTATQSSTLVPVGPIDGWYAYALDIRSRIELLPTVAKLVRDQGSPVEVEADPVRGLLNFTAAAPTEAEARNQVRAAVERAGPLLGASIGHNDYLIQPVGSMRIESKVSASAGTVLAAAAAGGGAALLSGLFFAGRTLPRREYEETTEPAVPQGVAT
jgi:O-antigen ligase